MSGNDVRAVVKVLCGLINNGLIDGLVDSLLSNLAFRTSKGVVTHCTPLPSSIQVKDLVNGCIGRPTGS